MRLRLELALAQRAARRVELRLERAHLLDDGRFEVPQLLRAGRGALLSGVSLGMGAHELRRCPLQALFGSLAPHGGFFAQALRLAGLLGRIARGLQGLRELRLLLPRHAVGLIELGLQARREPATGVGHALELRARKSARASTSPEVGAAPRACQRGCARAQEREREREKEHATGP